MSFTGGHRWLFGVLSGSGFGSKGGFGLADIVVVAGFLGVLAILMLPKLRNLEAWRATVTPLASIIGSGFLVVIPLFGHTLGSYAPLAMAAVLALAYGVGYVIRFNIRHVEGAIRDDAFLTLLEYAASLVLALAYFVSVAFYLLLLASFVLQTLGWSHEITEKIFASVILAAIGLIGWWRGLGFLEALEQYAVSIKLAIICGMIGGWFVWDLQILAADTGLFRGLATQDFVTILRILAGSLLVVQGFETSRYLGKQYDVALRIKTMRYAQWIATAIYMIFVIVCLPSFDQLPPEINETAIIKLSAQVSDFLPYLLVCAAVMSQFSAAVADTIGAGGLLVETGGRRCGVSAQHAYMLVAVVGITLMWLTNIFGIIAIASQCFAGYYLIQTLLALVVELRGRNRGRYYRSLFFAILALVLLAVVIWAKSAESTA